MSLQITPDLRRYKSHLISVDLTYERRQRLKILMEGNIYRTSEAQAKLLILLRGDGPAHTCHDHGCRFYQGMRHFLETCLLHLIAPQK